VKKIALLLCLGGVLFVWRVGIVHAGGIWCSPVIIHVPQASCHPNCCPTCSDRDGFNVIFPLHGITIKDIFIKSCTAYGGNTAPCALNQPTVGAIIAVMPYKNPYWGGTGITIFSRTVATDYTICAHTY
jgi:hypothetical protein